MSPGPAWAMSWREKTSSKPTSLARAVSTAGSSTRHRAGSGATGGRAAEQRRRGERASVALPPLPNVNSRPPAAEAVRHRARGRGDLGRRAGRTWRRAARRSAATLASADAARSTRSGAGVALVALDERIQEVGALGHVRASRHRPRRPRRRVRWPCRRGPAPGRPGRPRPPAACRRSSVPRAIPYYCVGPSPPSTTSATLPSSEQVMQTSSAHVVDRREQARMLEADVGQLPEQVVAQGQAAVVRRGGTVVVDPDHVIGGPGRGTRTRTDPHGGQPPDPGPLEHGPGRVRRAGPPRAGRRRRRTCTRRHETGSSSTTATAGSARLPMITGCTNSTATWCACSGQSGARHHIVAPAAKRRASASAIAARSSAVVSGRAVIGSRPGASDGLPG